MNLAQAPKTELSWAKRQHRWLGRNKLIHSQAGIHIERDRERHLERHFAIMMAFLIITALVAVVVTIHYEILRLLWIYVPRLPVRHRVGVVYGVFGTICAHIVAISLFGVAFHLMQQACGDFGGLHGAFDGSLVDAIYFSFTNYTTVGYGDIEPTGAMRFLAGVEAITGLSLITWSASLIFLEMTKFWDGK